MAQIKAGAPRRTARASRRAVLLLAGVGVAALAQGSALAAEAPTNAGTQVEEVIVTANRSGAQNLQNIAMAISAVNIDQVDKSGQGDILDLTKFTPSLSITVTIGVSCDAKLWIASVRLTFGGMSINRNSIRSIRAMSASRCRV